MAGGGGGPHPTKKKGEKTNFYIRQEFFFQSQKKLGVRILGVHNFWSQTKFGFFSHLI